MNTQKAFLEFRTHRGGNILDGKAGGVCPNDTIRTNHFFHFREEILFDLQVLDDDFQKKVNIFQHIQVVFEVSYGDQRSILL